MWNAHNYRPHESWQWWQRLAPRQVSLSGLARAQANAFAHYPWWQRLVHVFVPHVRNGYKPHAVRHPALAAYSLILIAAKVTLSLGLFLTFPTEAYFSSLTAQRVVTLTNEARAKAGIPLLKENDLLRASAGMKADEMAALGYFAHTSPKGEAPWEWFKRAHYQYTYAGENLAMDFRDAEEVITAWLASTRHRENILNPKYRDIGIAVTTGTVDGRTVTLVVQHFGTSFTAPPSSTFAGGGKAVAAGEGSAPQVAAASTEARIASGRGAWWGIALNVLPWVLGFFVFWLSIQLLLTLFVHVRVPHRGAVYAMVAVIGIAVGLLYTNVHFLERIGNAPIVF